ncbi:MAG: hypothetical protein F6J93_24285 [Oscillatoria sp. SIO1A7]|nr:hypothetical protein [Oscillatoria sp. SIO1A7]
MSNENEYLRDYKKASQVWDLERLFADLGEVKSKQKRSKELTDKEKKLLCWLLLGKSPKEIADLINNTPKTVRTELSNNLYSYIREFLGSNDTLDWTKVLVDLMYKGYLQNTIIITKQDTKELTLEIARDFVWQIKKEIGKLLQLEPPNRLEVKSTDYNRIYIKEITKIYFDDKLQIEASWEGQFREDAPPGLKMLLKTMLPKEIYKGGDYIEWVDAYGELRSSFGLSLDDQRNLHLTEPDVWVSPCSVPKAKFLEGIAQAFPDIQVRFHQPLKKFNLLASLDANKIFQELCREKYALENNRGRDLPKLEIIDLEIAGGQIRVKVREN